MKVAVIGATGSMGSAITRSLAKAGHELHVYSPNSEKLLQFVTAVKKDLSDAKIVNEQNSLEAAQAADVIIPAVWYSKQAEVAKEIAPAVNGKIVVNICNPFNETYDGLVTSPTTSAAEEFAKLLPDSKIVKAFNTVFAGDFVNPKFAGVVADTFVAGDDERAAETVSMLVKDAGFNPLYAGKLSRSRTLENMTVLLAGLTKRYNYENWLAGWKVLHK